jgi:hypothetical protein
LLTIWVCTRYHLEDIVFIRSTSHDFSLLLLLNHLNFLVILSSCSNIWRYSTYYCIIMNNLIFIYLDKSASSTTPIYSLFFCRYHYTSRRIALYRLIEKTSCLVEMVSTALLSTDLFVIALNSWMLLLLLLRIECYRPIELLLCASNLLSQGVIC